MWIFQTRMLTETVHFKGYLRIQWEFVRVLYKLRMNWVNSNLRYLSPLATSCFEVSVLSWGHSYGSSAEKRIGRKSLLWSSVAHLLLISLPFLTILYPGAIHMTWPKSRGSNIYHKYSNSSTLPFISNTITHKVPIWKYLLKFLLESIIRLGACTGPGIILSTTERRTVLVTFQIQSVNLRKKGFFHKLEKKIDRRYRISLPCDSQITVDVLYKC